MTYGRQAVHKQNQISRTEISHNLKLCTRLTHARAAFAVQIVEATETFFATRTVYQVALARLCDHALGDNRCAHSLVASVSHVRERDQRPDDSDKKYVLHLTADGS